MAPKPPDIRLQPIPSRGQAPLEPRRAGWWDSAAYKLFQILIKKSDRAVHRSGEVFGDIVIVAIVGIQISDAACVADLLCQADGEGQGHVFIGGTVMQL